MKFGLIFSGFLVLITGCSELPASTLGSAAPESTVLSNPSLTAQAINLDPAEPENAPENAPEISSLISAEGIGPVQLGMTLGDLRQAVGPTTELTIEPGLMKDFDAIAVRQNGEVQFYVLYLTGQALSESDVVQGLLTNNPTFQTADGIGPGVPLATTEATYGKATLSYHVQNESREYVRFEQHPAPNLSFSTGKGPNWAGLYPTTGGEYSETQSFQEGATIQSVLVVCLSEGCAAR